MSDDVETSSTSSTEHRKKKHRERSNSNLHEKSSQGHRRKSSEENTSTPSKKSNGRRRKMERHPSVDAGYVSLNALNIDAVSTEATVRSLQRELETERQRRLFAESECRDLKDALDRDVQTLAEKLESSNNKLSAEIARLQSALEERNAELSAQFQSFQAKVGTGSHVGPSTPGPATRGATPLSPVVQGLLGELDALDTELERRRHGSISHVAPMASLAPHASARDGEVDDFGGNASSETRRAHVSAMYAEEEDYLDSISSLITGYLEPFRERAELDASMLSEQDVGDIFRTVQQIHDSHRQIKLHLSQRLKDWSVDSEVGDFLCELPELFEPYTDYVVNFARASEVLQNLMENSDFRAFVDSLKRDKRVLRGRSLDELLRRPLKRVQQYVTNITELLHLTEDTHPDFESTTRALNYIRAFSAELSAAQRRSGKMDEIKSQIAGFPGLSLPNRVYIRDGPLTEIVDSKGKSRPLHLFLFNDVLIACEKSKKSKSLMLSRKGITKPYKFLFKLDIDSNTSIAEELPQANGLPNLQPQSNLILKSFDKTVNLLCTSPKERTEWAFAIQDALDAAYQQSQQHSAARNRSATIATNSPLSRRRTRGHNDISGSPQLDGRRAVNKRNRKVLDDELVVIRARTGSF